MRPLILSYDDGLGGAGRAAFRLHQGLNDIGVNARMLVQHKSTDVESISQSSAVTKRIAGTGGTLLRNLLTFVYPQMRHNYWETNSLPNGIQHQISNAQPDLVHLHWVNAGFLPVTALRKICQPLIWTFHDMWAFTGGCHYDQECGRYRESCGACPQLASQRQRDLSRWLWNRKRDSWSNVTLTVVTPSRWLANRAAESSLFRNSRIEVIPNGLNLSLFKPVDKVLARQLLGLPTNKKLILFGAFGGTKDPRKGFGYLESALKQLASDGWTNRAELVIFGSSQPANPPEFGFAAHYLGRLRDEISLVLAYSAADLFVAPSTQENLPNTIMESLACGTPCLAFDIGGIGEMISHRRNGYLAQPFETADLALGMAELLSADSAKLSRAARLGVTESFEVSSIAKRHLALYEELVSSSASALLELSAAASR